MDANIMATGCAATGEVEEVASVKEDVVLLAEAAQVAQRRCAIGIGDATPPTSGDASPTHKRLAEQETVGLAFSGGGIRSATFNLGVLQGLAQLRLLRYVDYLSTVSGGGYIGAWFTSLVLRSGGLEAAERKLQPASTARQQRGSAEEPHEIHHLRRYSNYLAPRVGFLTADTWVLYAIYLRNFLLCQAVLLPSVALILVFVRLALLLYHPDLIRQDQLGIWPYIEYMMLGVIALLWLTAAGYTLAGAFQVRQEGETGAAAPVWPRRLFGVVVLFVLSAVLFCYFPTSRLQNLEPRWTWVPFYGIDELVARCTNLEVSEAQLLLAYVAIPGVLLLISSLAVYMKGASDTAKARPARDRKAVWMAGCRTALQHSVWITLAGMLGGLLLFAVFQMLTSLYAPGRTDMIDVANARGAVRVATFGPPLVLGVITITIFLSVGLLNFHLEEGVREWWSSLCARLLVAAVGWLAVALIAFYAAPAVLWAGPWAKLLLSSGWLLTVLAGVLSGGGSTTDGNRPQKTRADMLARLAPPLFLVGLLMLVSLALHRVLDNPPLWPATAYLIDWPVVKEPTYAVKRATTTRIGNAALPSEIEEQRRQKVTETTIESKTVEEQTSRLDDAELALQAYWLGIFNARDAYFPKRRFELRLQDLRTLRTAGVPPLVLAELRDLIVADEMEASAHRRAGSLRRVSETEMQDKLAPILELLWTNPDTEPSHRELIEWVSREGDLIHFDGGAILAKLVLALAVLGGVAGLAAWRVDVNRFSLHALYGNRLVRCYLGATRPEGERTPDPFTGFDPNDDLSLAALSAGPTLAGPLGHEGPLLIVNTALNLVHDEELAWQERQAESFVLTPLYCGSTATDYYPTAGYSNAVRLGTAVTISGAAVSPNSGYHSSPAVTALLTVFNARLGAWLPNPRRPSSWQQHSPGFYFLFRELFGLTSDHSPFVYLSDGGHFENLGVYELVRRRCRYIISSDADEDPQHTFENLGDLIRKCRVDFGIRIDIDVDALRPTADGGKTRWHCAVGTIHYEDVDSDALPGTLIYLKPSLTGDEPADIVEYHARFPAFPHEATLDQFFSESQFESYRALGLHILQAVFAESRDEMRDDLAGRHQQPLANADRRQACRLLFSSLVRRWFAMPPHYEESFVTATQGFMEVHSGMADNDKTRRLAQELYPELTQDPAPLAAGTALEKSQAYVELHNLVCMLQVMENAWLSLHLDVHYAHPLNRGWMDAFYRWSSTPVFRGLWPVVRSEFGRAFVRFCERQMGLGSPDVSIAPIKAWQDIPARLRTEFDDEWLLQSESLATRFTRVVDSTGPLCWLIKHGSIATCGLIMIATVPNEKQVYELLIWVRGAYRNSGIGRLALRKAMDEPRLRALGQSFRLRVRLPEGRLSGAGGNLLQSMWLTFFHHEGFRRVEQPPAQAALPTLAARAHAEREACVLLERTIP